MISNNEAITLNGTEIEWIYWCILVTLIFVGVAFSHSAILYLFGKLLRKYKRYKWNVAFGIGILSAIIVFGRLLAYTFNQGELCRVRTDTLISTKMGDWGGAIAPVMDELPLKGDTVIGNDVWIGQNVTIMPGVHIGDGAIIGTNATVASDIPSFSIAVGNPAKVIRRRFDDEMIILLERLQWWNRPIKEVDKLVPILSNPDIALTKNKIETYLQVNNRTLLICITCECQCPEVIF